MFICLATPYASGKSSQTIEGFMGAEQVTRAEAVQWFRKLQLKGMNQLQQRPESPSDRSLLSNLPPSQSDEMPDFVFTQLTLEDFNLNDPIRNISFKMGSSRESIEEQIGISTEQNYSKYDTYGRLFIHYDANGLMDSWYISDSIHLPFQTNRGVKLEESTYFDILSIYGTAGGDFNNYGLSLNYLYEEVDGKLVPRFSRYEIVDTDHAYNLSFIIDKKTYKVNYIHVSTYNFGYIEPIEKYLNKKK